jgi:obg-like ATPase 1
VALETRVFESSPEERQKYLEDNKTTSMINRIIRTGYNILDLIYYFTAGTPEVRCWTIRRGTKAPQAAGVIHTDFERGFICAEVMKYDDFVEHGSEAAVKSEGKLRQHGKDYEVEDGDIIHFKFNVTSSAKK